MQRPVSLRWGMSVFVVLIAGCGRPDHSGGGNHSSAPKSSQLSPATEIPVVYLPRLNPVPLNEEQAASLVDRTTEAGYARDEIWFFLVRSNTEGERARVLTASVYLKPFEETAEMRKGRTLYFDDSFRKLRETFEKAMTPEQRAELLRKWKSGPDSIYVSISGTDSGGQSVHRAPSIPDLPFSMPDGFTESDVVEIARFAKAHQESLQVDDNQPLPSDFREYPILSIERRKDDNIDVRFGYIYGPASGKGITLTLAKNENGYVVISQGMWVS